MASILVQPKRKPLSQQTAQPVAKSSTHVATPAAADEKNHSLQGIAKNAGDNANNPGTTTPSTTGAYNSPYTPSAGVQAAQDYLNGIIGNRPTADPTLSALYDQIMNREDFSYDLNGDALYQQYKDRFQNMGQQAMMDTMGNAAAMTGGYGSSYASTAGNQAYQQYLQQLNDIVPDLYQQAYDRYQQEGADLMNMYSMAYGQYRDQVSDWEGNRDYAYNNYWNQYNADYNAYLNSVNQGNADREYAYNLVMAMIKRGKMPSAEMLAAAGLTEDDAKKLGAKTSGKKSGSSSGSGNSGNNASGDQNATSSYINPMWLSFYTR